MRRRIAHGCGALVLGALLTAGCSATDDGADSDAGKGEAREPAGGEGTGFTPDPDRVPADRERAAELAEAVVAQPETFGPGFVEAEGRSGDTGEWPVLDENCVWVLEPVPDGVLASLTRHAELPAEDGADPLRVTAVATVHSDPRGAEWEMARTVEDALRCPDQQLRRDEWVSGLISVAMEFGTLGNSATEDLLTETGSFHSDELGGPHDFEWMRARIGPLTLAVSAKGADGRGDGEVSRAAVEALGLMSSRAENELAPEPSGPGGEEDKNESGNEKGENR
ncbi:hypothetical protein GCM10009716_23560 [Streptomyces sodiiphilus]|uniref:Secreted protein n=1 Tax=Streptomyces sodiiphilus TaxID=226217 RepID=A0ABP5AIW5_9ACTN